MRIANLLTVTLLLTIAAAATAATPTRDQTRESLRSVLTAASKRADVNTEFRQSTKEPFNFVGSMTNDLHNSQSLEIVISVTPSDTISVRVYPHYAGGYINVKKAKDGQGLMHELLRFSDRNFLYWAVDSTDDVFCGYTVTLESGFPDEAMLIVLRSLRATDKFVGELRPFIDGSAAKK